MAIIERISRDLVLPYGEENSVGSVYKWFSDLFGHDNGYDVYFDKDNSEFVNRTSVTFPSINVVQIDTQDMSGGNIGNTKSLMPLLFYVYFSHHIAAGGSRRLVRRGRDHIMYALKMAGTVDRATNQLIVPPIYLYDFSKNPIEKMGCISIGKDVQQRFIQDGELIQEELIVSMSYIENLTL